MTKCPFLLHLLASTCAANFREDGCSFFRAGNKCSDANVFSYTIFMQGMFAHVCTNHFGKNDNELRMQVMCFFKASILWATKVCRANRKPKHCQLLGKNPFGRPVNIQRLNFLIATEIKKMFFVLQRHFLAGICLFS